MDIEKQVVSLELAKKLRKAGYPLDSLYCYCDEPRNGKPRLVHTESHYALLIHQNNKYPAPTVAELGEKLGVGYWSRRYANCWGSENYPLHGQRKIFIQADTEADARAKMVLYLLEKGLIKF